LLFKLKKIFFLEKTDKDTKDIFCLIGTDK